MKTPSVPRFELKLPASQIKKFAQEYSYGDDDQKLISLAPEVQKSGILTLEQLLSVGKWKANRAAWHLEKNPDSFVREATKVAFSATNEQLRIGVLQCLEGVAWPMASVILHFFHRDPYPILDFRALESLGVEAPSAYTFGFWSAYVEYCRNLASSEGITMRTLDRALWERSSQASQKRKRRPSC